MIVLASVCSLKEPGSVQPKKKKKRARKWAKKKKKFRGISVNSYQMSSF